MTDSPTPPAKPSALLAIASLVVIVYALFVSGLALSLAITLWEIEPLIVMLVIALLHTHLAWRQYGGVMRERAFDLRLARYSLYFVGGLLLFLACLLLFFRLSPRLPEGSPFSQAPPVAVWGLLVFTIVLCLGTSWLNRRREKQLQQNDLPARRTQFSLRDLMLLVAGLAILLASTSLGLELRGKSWRSIGPLRLEHVSADEVPFPLPATATDVSFVREDTGNIYLDFLAEEPEFRRWVESGVLGRSNPSYVPHRAWVVPCDDIGRGPQHLNILEIPNALRVEARTKNAMNVAVYDLEHGRVYLSSGAR